MKSLRGIVPPFTQPASRRWRVQTNPAMWTTINRYEENRGNHFLPKLKIEVVITDSQVDAAVAAIIKGAKTGKIGDGKIFVSDVQEAVRIRTEEKGEQAV